MKKFFIIIIIIGILIGGGIFWYIKRDVPNENSESTNIENQFKISKIYYYSNVNAVKNDTSYQNPEWNLNLYQYTDVAIYIDRLKDYGFENYIKKIYIDNIHVNNLEMGTQSLFYLNPTHFGDDYFDMESNEINESLEYNMLNSENEKNDISYDMPIYFQDLSNPITFKYLNKDIVKNYKISNEQDINFDGSLLEMAGIELKKIENHFNLNLNVITKDDNIHTVTLSLKIPLKNEENTIYDNGIELVENKMNIEF